MANHKSALKRIRSSEKRRVSNRYNAKGMRAEISAFRALENKEEAEKKLPVVFQMIDKNAKRSIIHKNKAANLKGKLAKHAQSLA